MACYLVALHPGWLQITASGDKLAHIQAWKYLELVYEIYRYWPIESVNEVTWIILNALRHAAKKGDRVALRFRVLAWACK